MSSGLSILFWQYHVQPLGNVASLNINLLINFNFILLCQIPFLCFIHDYTVKINFLNVKRFNVHTLSKHGVNAEHYNNLNDSLIHSIRKFNKNLILKIQYKIIHKIIPSIDCFQSNKWNLYKCMLKNIE